MTETFDGRLQRSPFGGGWLLRLPDGGELTLSGAVPASMREGDDVTVEGAIREDAMSIDMVGPVLEARSVRKR